MAVQQQKVNNQYEVKVIEIDASGKVLHEIILPGNLEASIFLYPTFYLSTPLSSPYNFLFDVPSIILQYFFDSIIIILFSKITTDYQPPATFITLYCDQSFVPFFLYLISLISFTSSRYAEEK